MTIREFFCDLLERHGARIFDDSDFCKKEFSRHGLDERALEAKIFFALLDKNAPLEIRQAARLAKGVTNYWLAVKVYSKLFGAEKLPCEHENILLSQIAMMADALKKDNIVQFEYEKKYRALKFISNFEKGLGSLLDKHGTEIFLSPQKTKGALLDICEDSLAPRVKIFCAQLERLNAGKMRRSNADDLSFLKFLDEFLQARNLSCAPLQETAERFKAEKLRKELEKKMKFLKEVEKLISLLKAVARQKRIAEEEAREREEAERARIKEENRVYDSLLKAEKDLSRYCSLESSGENPGFPRGKFSMAKKLALMDAEFVGEKRMREMEKSRILNEMDRLERKRKNLADEKKSIEILKAALSGKKEALRAAQKSLGAANQKFDEARGGLEKILAQVEGALSIKSIFKAPLEKRIEADERALLRRRQKIERAAFLKGEAVSDGMEALSENLERAKISYAERKRDLALKGEALEAARALAVAAESNAQRAEESLEQEMVSFLEEEKSAARALDEFCAGENMCAAKARLEKRLRSMQLKLLEYKQKEDSERLRQEQKRFARGEDAPSAGADEADKSAQKNVARGMDWFAFRRTLCHRVEPQGAASGANSRVEKRGKSHRIDWDLVKAILALLAIIALIAIISR